MDEAGTDLLHLFCSALLTNLRATIHADAHVYIRSDRMLEGSDPFHHSWGVVHRAVLALGAMDGSDGLDTQENLQTASASLASPFLIFTAFLL